METQSAEPTTFNDLDSGGMPNTVAQTQVQDSDPIWGDQKGERNGQSSKEKSSEKSSEKISSSKSKELLEDKVEAAEPKLEDKTPEQTQDKTQEQKAQAAKAKFYKVKVGENEIDFPDDATFPLKVGGQTVNVPLKDLASEYAGRTDWSVKYSQLDREKKSFHNERSALDNRVKRLYELAVVEKNPQEALLYLADAVNAQDPFQVLNTLKEQFKAQWDASSGLSEAEIAKQEADMQTKYYKNKLASRDKETETQKRNADFATLVDEVGLENVEAIWNEFKAAGKKDAGIAEIRERFKTYSTEKSVETSIRTAIDELNPEYGSKDKLTTEAMRLIKATGLGAEDAKLIVEELMGPKPEVLAKKIIKSKPAVQGIRKQLDEATFFGDLDAE